MPTNGHLQSQQGATRHRFVLLPCVSSVHNPTSLFHQLTESITSTRPTRSCRGVSDEQASDVVSYLIHHGAKVTEDEWHGIWMPTLCPKVTNFDAFAHLAVIVTLLA